jgi:CDP-diacylglycerol--glycerol-3-phosphate 3-phosphatidyltransferase
MKHLPNALTLLRLVLAPIVAWLFLTGMARPADQHSDTLAIILPQLASLLTWSAILFVVGALTDLFDGMIARAFNYHSKFGRIIDPIADKALVGMPLIAIAIVAATNGLPEWPYIAGAAAIIVVRDISMTVIRFMSPDGEGVRVSSLAKWKTALELIVVGSFLVVAAMETHLIASGSLGAWAGYAETFRWTWLGLLLITAALSAWTALQYLRPMKAPA